MFHWYICVYIVEQHNSDWWFVRKYLTQEKGLVPAALLQDEPSYTAYVQKKVHQKIDKLPVFDSKYVWRTFTQCEQNWHSADETCCFGETDTHMFVRIIAYSGGKYDILSHNSEILWSWDLVCDICDLWKWSIRGYYLLSIFPTTNVSRDRLGEHCLR